MTPKNKLLYVEAVLLFGPVVWIVLSMLYFAIHLLSIAGITFVVPGILGSIGFKMLFSALKNQQPLKMPIFTFCLCIIGCLLCAGFAFADDFKFNFINATFLLPILVFIHFSWLYFKSTVNIETTNLR